ncbi:hypothetical protein AXF42_Ash005183 [Apostasia shenzhenica]|uniref:Uncharacterized protein n=1 Tax=Apostasia shenzhenica TaxID=1088818 RepID=A0A2I0B8Q3_9ASPA|nr:hypothetical protein AXF42_Ash005183 [Apostasia shenzhenica]
MGRLRLMPRTLPLRAVQRQTAASRLASPWSRVQQGTLGGLPRFRFISPSTLAHTPNFRASRGHLPPPADGAVPADGPPRDGVPADGPPRDGVPADGAPGDGVAGDGVAGVGTGVVQVLQELTREKKRRLRARRREEEAVILE